MRLLFCLLGSLLIYGCQHTSSIQDDGKIIAKNRHRYEGYGKLFKDKLSFGNSTVTQDAQNAPSIMWRASLDILSNFAIQSTDYVGGVIVSDWYQCNTSKNERFKITLQIMSHDLRADALKITIHKQQYQGNQWIEAQVSNKIAEQIENKIINRAKQIHKNRILAEKN